MDKTYLLKVVILGPKSVGKTSIWRRCTGRSFEKKYDPVLSEEISTTMIRNDHTVWIRVFEEVRRDDKLIPTASYYFDGSSAIILVVDLSVESYLSDLNEYMREINAKMNRPDLPIAIVGNKVDLISNTDQPTDTLLGTSDILDNANYKIFLCSAKEDHNIESVFDWITEESMRIDTGVLKQ